MNCKKGIKLYKYAKTLIPGGTHLLSKRPEMFLPDQWPSYYSKCKGVEVWDLDGNKFIEASINGVAACILGYADPDVDTAVKRAIDKGVMCTLNCPEEVELAELFCELHPWADMVRYARTGGEAMTIAVRIGRAKAGKDVVLFCGYHGWHDWYLAANLASNKSLNGHLLPGLNPLGVPRSLRGTSIPFSYNDTKGFLKLIKKHKNNIGVVVMESSRNNYPAEGFLETIREVTKALGVVLIFDEITAGWRLNMGGAHLIFNITPDIAVFAKAVSNGFPMAVIIGKEKVMEMAQDTFISSTFWTDKIGPTAAIATIKKARAKNVPQHLIKIGREIKESWKEIAGRYDIGIEISGIDPLPHFSFKYKKPLVLKTLFTQLMLDRGFLAVTSFCPSYAHKDGHIKKYRDAADEAFSFISRSIRRGNPEKYLRGPVSHSGFKRLT